MVLLMVIGQLAVLVPSVSADLGPDQTLHEEFSGNQSTIILRFDGNSTNTSAALEIPQNTTVDELRFLLQYQTTDPSPGQLTLDLDQDGIPEWAYQGVGYGRLGSQTEFSDGSNSNTTIIPIGVSAGPSILLPADMAIISSTIELNHTAENGGKWLTHEGLIDVSTADIDNDQLEEAILLSNNHSGRGDYGVGWVDGTSSNNSFSGISWIDTCDDTSNIEVGDFNADGYDDVMVWSPLLGIICYHLWDAALQAFSASVDLTLGQSIAGLVTSDFNMDGSTDLVWADPAGTYTMLQWDANSSEMQHFDNWDYMTDPGTGLVPSQISRIGAGTILGGGVDATLVVVSEYGTVDTISWELNANGSRGDFVPFPTSYQNMQQNFLWLADLNGDNWVDIITWDYGTNGSLLISTPNQPNLYAPVQQTGMTAPIGAITTDYDQDGVIDILIPEPPSPDLDDDDNTLNGSLQVFTFSGQLVDTSQRLRPRTMPTLVVAADMTGDGRDEIISICGESMKGLFIDSWHEVRFDFDGDGAAEASIDGFAQAQSGANGTRSMFFKDTSGSIATVIEANLATYWDFHDTNGMHMVQLNSSFELETAGTVALTSMDLGYDFDSYIEKLASGGNLSQLINTVYMEFGDQNFNVSLPFNATLPGRVSLSQLVLVTSPGHPRLPNLDSLTLTLNDMQDDWAEIGWNMVTTEDSYFSQYSLYRSTLTNASYPADFSLVASHSNYTTLSYLDTGLPEGGHYEYVIQVEFDADGTLLYNAISDSLIVDIPMVPRVENVTASDTPDDMGEMITIYWSEIDRFDGGYNIFVRGENFTDTTLLTPATIALEGSATSITADKKSGSRYENGTPDESKTDIVDEEPLWVAVVAYNDSGFNPFVSPFGPIYALDNNVRITTLTLVLSTPTVLGVSQPEQDWIVAGASTSVSMTLTTDVDAVGVEGAMLLLNMTIAGTHFVEFNVTTDAAGEAIVEFQWLDIASTTIQTDGGDVTLQAYYAGRTQSLERGPMAASEEDMDAKVVVPATFRLLTTNVMVGVAGFAELTVELVAEHAWQQPAFTGTEISFSIYQPNGALVNFETFILSDISGSMTEFVQGDLNGGWANISLPDSVNPANPSAWRITDTMWLNATLFEYNDTGQTDLDVDSDGVLNDDDLCPGTPVVEVAQVDSDGCSPSQLDSQIDIVDPTLNCTIGWTISNVKFSQNDHQNCILSNPNDAIMMVIEPSIITVGGIQISVDCVLGTNQNYVQPQSTTTCRFSPSVTADINKTTDNPVPSSFNVELRFEWTATITTQVKTITYQIGYDLIGNATGDGEGTDVDPKVEEISEDKQGLLDNKMLLGGIAAGVIGLLLVIIIVVRVLFREDDDWDDEWEDEDDDEELENPLDRILGRTPLGGGYEGGTAAGGAMAGDDRFEREPNRGRMGGGAGSGSSKQDQQDDPSYSVDEDGTEWWEDEHGQWWYRTPQMDDWDVWNE